MKKIPCLLALALFLPSLPACKSETAKSDPNAGAPAQKQTLPQPNSQQPIGTAVRAPSKFKEVFVGAIDDKHAVRMELEREGGELKGDYFYERAGAFNVEMEKLELEGRIDGEGNVNLTETSYKAGNLQKTGEFKGKLDGLSADGKVILRFSGLWTSGEDGKQMPFNLRQLRIDLGGLRLHEKKENSANKKLRYEIETAAPHLAGADTARVEKFNQAVADFVAAHTGEFKKAVDEMARKEAAPKKDSKSAPDTNFMYVSYEIIAADKDFISVLFSIFGNASVAARRKTMTESFFGNTSVAAHGKTITESFNYDLNRNAPVSLADLFAPGSDYLKAISDYAIKELKNLLPAVFVWDGAGPVLENFHSWNITPAGLRITFDHYQIGPYQAGVNKVIVPYSVLKPIIKPDGMLSQFAK